MKLARSLATFSFIAVCFTYLVIGAGAFTRMKDAGLGCPDWPGCYGRLVVQPHSITPENTLQKAHIEMAHRYIAGTLGIFILAIIFLSAITAAFFGSRFAIFSLLLFFLLIYQVVLGMLTVTLKLSPLFVMQHLLAGLLILSLLWLIHLSARSLFIEPIKIVLNEKIRLYAAFCFVLLFLQIVLGGWTSGHAVGLVYSGLSAVHRWGGLIMGCALLVLFLSIQLHYRDHSVLKKVSWGILFLVAVQIGLGISNVIFQLPLSVAIAHNLVAATLLLMVLTMNYYLWYEAGRQHEHFSA